MRKLFLLLPLVGLFACSSVRTTYDYDKQVDFAKYKTFAFSQDDLAASVGQLNRDRIMKNMEAEMLAKGFTKSGTPDVIVDVHIKSQKKMEATAVTDGYSYGPYRYGYGRGYSTTHVNYDEYTEGTLFISIIDSATEKIVWQGTGTKTFDETASAEKRDANINYAIKQILLNYPPKKK
jgi:hypothetical protein